MRACLPKSWPELNTIFLSKLPIWQVKIFIYLFPFITSEIEHFFMHLQVIYNHCSVNFLFISLAHFSPRTFLFIYDNCLYIDDLNSFIYVVSISIFICIFLRYCFFNLEKFYIFIWLNYLSLFSFVISGLIPWLESSFYLKLWILTFKDRICIIYFFVCPKISHIVLDLRSLIEERLTGKNTHIFQADE